MKLLVIGAAGTVGSIVRPGLEAEHECCYLDQKPVIDREDRTIVASVHDHEAVDRGVRGQDAVIYMAMGGNIVDGPGIDDIELAFGVNCGGLYRALRTAARAGVKRFVFTSTYSVYRTSVPGFEANERVEPNEYESTYGLSKRCSELICRATSDAYPEMTIVALRLFHPSNEERFQRVWAHPDIRTKKARFATGPNDTRRLFLAALALDRPGCHVVNTCGEVEGKLFDLTKARELLGWAPRGE